jgi:hypothetical protein
MEAVPNSPMSIKLVKRKINSRFMSLALLTLLELWTYSKGALIVALERQEMVYTS